MLKKKIGPPYYEIIQPIRLTQGTLTQAGTNPPTANYLNDEITGLIWTRVDVGRYSVTWDGFDNTINTITVMNSKVGVTVSANDPGTSILYITTFNYGTAGYEDNGLLGSYFEITSRQILS